MKNGMTQDIAESIYTDWEEFARYGFNKSHAADYGVIAVQTAYLKVNYTAEYMAALLSASAGQTEKIALYVADARSMGVPVLAPDINTSGWDFEIEDLNNNPQIRFGLGAIKNVSQNAVETIMGACVEGKFKDLNDFARRVDLRAVGKRSLECLIKVGALDAFGNRAALLASLDRIVALSNNHFRAADAGQMSLFGAATGVVEEVHLPDVDNVDKREMLNWERELIGLYISDHPLIPYQQTLAQIVSHFSGQLGETQHEEKVRVAGLVTMVRPYTTKTGKPMGFVTIEDIQGNIELVLFPKTWTRTREMLTVGQIIVVDGKVDTSNTPPKILVDGIKTDMTVAADEVPVVDFDSPKPPPKPLLYKPVPSPALAPGASVDQTQGRPVPVKKATQPAVAESTSAYAADADFDDMPPPPDNFPAGWENEWQPSFDNAQIAARPEPKKVSQDNIPITPLRAIPESLPVVSEPDEREQVEASRESGLPLHAVPLPSLYIPLAKEEDRDHPPKQITIQLRSTGDKERDKRRIKTVYGTLISYHGRDKFSFQIFESGKGHLIDFPSDTTRVCPELLERVKKLMGEESWRVEEITFQ